MINKNGKAVIVSTAEYEQLELYRKEYLKAEIEAGTADLETGKITDGVEVFKRLRKRITYWKIITALHASMATMKHFKQTS